MPGRYFTANHELLNAYEGIDRDLYRESGTTVLWYRYDPAAPKDDVYDIGYGRDWGDPIELPVISAARMEGFEERRDTGMYSTDHLQLVISYEVAREKLPGIENDHQPFYKDRVVYDGVVFSPSDITVRGFLHRQEVVIGIILYEVDPDELINDPDFFPFTKAPDDGVPGPDPSASVDGGYPGTTAFGRVYDSGGT